MVVSDYPSKTVKSSKLGAKALCKDHYTRMTRAFWNSETPRHLAYNDKRIISNLMKLAELLNDPSLFKTHEEQFFSRATSRACKIGKSGNAMIFLTDMVRYHMPVGQIK